ncbi:hypothetical protein AO073_08315 [Pseudomonas syringae ICMP 11293]|nr:hypothetical protein PSYRMG_06835 [Pseudomonas syringae UMAF0158]KTB89275.1 hypothetical protein AO073_08315 [Pseudomonas syringae ICMP 11293]KTC01075.1 hypothetical protein AO388_16270 [Pseudomonas sp. ICMP 10191]KWS39751.1 hypothetical protein AL059_24460 [Pseudomonas syringae pv. papulans]PHN78796.1 hypothetical protein AO071_10260 [Pseudomonas syringae]POR57426.1 hypothetical protein BKM23_22855 [Pseudomonas syringae pv. syringae]
MRGALAFYTVTGIIYSEGALAIIHFIFAARRWSTRVALLVQNLGNTCVLSFNIHYRDCSATK